jgi:nucleotide-binding universal stress UspA family protein
MFKKILLAIDGSEESRKAEEYAFELAKNLSGEVTAINVVEISAAAVAGVLSLDAMEGTGSDALYPQAFKNSKIFLKNFKARAKKKGVKASVISKVGRAWNEIINESESGNYSMIVLGSKGLSGITRMLIGSVAENVARHSKCPVLIVK